MGLHYSILKSNLVTLILLEPSVFFSEWRNFTTSIDFSFLCLLFQFWAAAIWFRLNGTGREEDKGAVKREMKMSHL